MPYTIVTKDNIEIRNIPDSVPRDSPELKARVAQERQKLAGQSAPAASPQAAAAPRQQQAAPPQQEVSLGAALKKLATDRLVAPAEIIGRFAYGAAAMPVAGLAGMAQGAYNIGREAVGLESGMPAADVVENVTGALGEAQTQGAAQFEQGLGKILTPVQEIIRTPGEMVAEAGYPVAGAILTAAPETALTMVAPEVRGAFRSVARGGRSNLPVIPPAVSPPPPLPTAPPPPPPPPGAPPVPPVAPVTESSGAAAIIDLARRAGGTGPGSAAAREQLAREAALNLDAKAAAERLGIDLPFDVFSENPQVRSAVGLTRSEVGSTAEAAWQQTTRNALEKSDKVMRDYDAMFVEGRPSPGGVSQKVLDNLTNQQKKLEADAQALYETVEAQVPKTAPVTASNLSAEIAKIRQELGDSVKNNAVLKKLEDLANGQMTYGGLSYEKSQLGAAKRAGQVNEYSTSIGLGLIKRLESAAAKDQLANVRSIGGDTLAQQLESANSLFAQQRLLEGRIVEAFGTAVNGSIAEKMTQAITNAANAGGTKAFNQLLDAVPQALQRETLATALSHVTRGKAVGAGVGTEVAFSPSEFTKVYRGLRANPPVYAKMVQIMGPEWDAAMRDLYQVSRKIADAQGRVLVTGKANQIIANNAVDGLLGRIMSSGVAQRAATSALGTVPLGGAVAPDVIAFMQNTKGAAVQKASKVFASPEFEQLAIETAQRGGRPSDAAIRRAAMSKSFQEFAKASALPVDLNGRISWLRAAIQGGIAAGQQQQQQTEQ